MTKKELLQALDDLLMIEFSFHGLDGHIDPYSARNILLFFDGEEQTVNSVEAALTTPFVNGKSIVDVLPDLEDVTI